MINLIFCIGFIILSVILGLYVYMTWHFDYWIKRKIPGPTPRLLYGSFPGTIDGKRNFIYDLDELYRQFKDKAKFIGVFMTRSPQLMILDPELCKDILITNFKCFQDNESSIRTDRVREPISGSNPFVLPSNEWKSKRAEIVPGLTSTKLKGMFPLIDNICAQFRLYIKNELNIGNSTINAKDVALLFTSEVVADLVWGIKADNFSAPKIKSSIYNMSKTMIAQNFHAFNYYFFMRIFPFIHYFYYVRFFPVITDRFFLKLTQTALQQRQTLSNSKREDFLQFMMELQQKKGISDTEVVAHNLTFLFDGFETSATLISHCLLLLARYPEAQLKLRKEIQQQEKHLDSHSNRLCFDDLVKLPYLEQCLAETLRIFTPLPFMAKVCTQSCDIVNSDGIALKIQPGDICLISLHSMHHDEEFFPQPEEFMPERFAAANGGTKKYKDMGVYLPFGDGPRICLGMKFALTQAKAAIVEVIKHFELTVNERTRQDNYQSADSFMSGLEGGVYLDVREL